MIRIPILTYHSIDDSGSVISVDPKTFVNHIQFLEESEFQVISLTDAIQYLKGAQPADRKVVLTFDDGFESFYTHAFPVLTEKKMPATVFLVTGYCGKDNNWPGQSKEAPRLPLLNWRMVCELRQNGIELGAHSCTHPDLTRMSPDQAEREIIDSRNEIQNKTGLPVIHFAYPYGKSNSLLHKVVAANFEAGLGTSLAEASNADEIFNLSRVDVYYIFTRFKMLRSSWFTSYLTLRNIPRTLRERF
jgi:peptidoglycan/xylan/chitin deacetylase (PgdA/CDA1 family)